MNQGNKDLAQKTLNGSLGCVNLKVIYDKKRSCSKIFYPFFTLPDLKNLKLEVSKGDQEKAFLEQPKLNFLKKTTSYKDS